jgi:hypothetical protein
MIEEIETEIEILEEGLGLIVAEPQVRDILSELEELHMRRGSHFIWQLKVIASHPSFSPVENETNIFSTGGEGCEDYENLLSAARKAVEHGYRVFILPNPQGIRTADFIFERKGVYKLFDLKTISGKNSVGNRLKESIGQTNRVLINMTVDYNPRQLAISIRQYFEKNNEALEVMIIKGGKIISVIREDVMGASFIKYFMMKYTK